MGCGEHAATVEFTYFRSESNWDFLNAFSAAVAPGGVMGRNGVHGDLGHFSGQESPGTIANVSVVQYIMDSSVQAADAGFTAVLHCDGPQHSAEPALNASADDGPLVVEGGRDHSYGVALDSEPVEEVQVSVLYAGGIRIEPTLLTFTPSNWDVAQLIHVVAVDDDVAEALEFASVWHESSSADPNYVIASDRIERINVTVVSDDVAGLLVSASQLNISEGDGGEGSYSVRLSSRPVLHGSNISSVTVSVVVDGAEVRAEPSELTFTSLDWDVNQLITLYAVDDSIDEGISEGTVIGHELTSADDGFYVDLSGPSLVAWVFDNDDAGVEVHAGSLNVTEGGMADVYSLVLTSQPEGEVVVSTVLSEHGSSQLVVQPTELRFTAVTWNVPRQVSVMAINDHVAEFSESLTIEHSVGSTESPHCAVEVQEDCTAGSYDGIPMGSYTLTVHDNNVAGAIVEPASVHVSEGGAAEPVCVRLSSQPVEEVHVSVRAVEWYSESLAGVGHFDWTAAGFVSGVSLDGSDSLVLHFDASSWNSSVCFDLSAAEDYAAEPTRLFQVFCDSSSADWHYSNRTELETLVTLEDNDVGSVVASAVDGPLAEAGGNVSYSLSLTSQPVLPVLLNLSLIVGDDYFNAASGRMILLREDGAQPEGWSNAEITDAGSAGLVHGPWGNDATDVFIDVAVPAGYERCEVSWVSWIADSRDHEVDSVLIDGVEVWSMAARCWEDDKGEGWTFAPPDFPNPYDGHAPNQACFAAVTVEAPCSGTMRLNFVSGINQDEADESWAFSNVSVVALSPHEPPPEPEPEPAQALAGWAPAACPDADYADFVDIALVSGCAHESMLVRLGDCTEAEWQLQIPTPGRLRIHHVPDESGSRDLTDSMAFSLLRSGSSSSELLFTAYNTEAGVETLEIPEPGTVSIVAQSSIVQYGLHMRLTALTFCPHDARAPPEPVPPPAAAVDVGGWDGGGGHFHGSDLDPAVGRGAAVGRHWRGGRRPRAARCPRVPGTPAGAGGAPPR